MTDLVCVICDDHIDKQYTTDGTMFWDQGHNAQPVREGRCCSMCHEFIVLPAVLKAYNRRDKNDRYRIPATTSTKAKTRC